MTETEDSQQQQPASPNSRTGASSPDSSTLMVEHTDTASAKEDDFLPIDSGSPKHRQEQLDHQSKLDRFLQGYGKFMSAGVHQDRSIKLLQYTLWMVSHFGVGSNNNGNNGSSNVVIRQALKKLSNEMSFARYVLRFLEWPQAIEAAKSGSWTVSSTLTSHQSIHKWLGRILAWSMVGYYPLEYGSYLQWQTPTLLFPTKALPPLPRLAEKLSAWSCRAWLAYIVADMMQSWLKLREEQQLLQQQTHAKKTDGDDDDSNTSDKNDKRHQLAYLPNATTAAAMKKLRLQIVRGALFALPAIHWSLPNWDRDPWLPEPVVNTLMWLEAVVCMYQSVSSFQSTTA